MAAPAKGKRVDFLSDEFDALTALYSENVAVPCPDVKPFNNLAEYENVMQRRNRSAVVASRKAAEAAAGHGEAAAAAAGSDPLERTNAEREILFRQMMQRAAKIKQDRMLSDPLLPNLPSDDDDDGKEVPADLPELMLKGKPAEKTHKNVLSRMKAYGQRKKGPLSVLYRAVEERIRVKVWTRSAKQMRGYCKGYIVAFDKHWNLAMVDVDEVFSKPCLPRTPYPSCKALQDEQTGVVMTLNEEEPGKETAIESQMEMSPSKDNDAAIDALALRMGRQDLSSEPDVERSKSGKNVCKDRFDELDGREEKKIEGHDNRVPSIQGSVADIIMDTEVNKSDAQKINVSESSFHRDKPSVESSCCDVGGSGDSQMKQSPKTMIDQICESEDFGNQSRSDEKHQSSTGTIVTGVLDSNQEVVLEECDMEVGGYEVIGTESVDVSVSEEGLAQCGWASETEDEPVSSRSKKQSRQSDKEQLEEKDPNDVSTAASSASREEPSFETGEYSGGGKASETREKRVKVPKDVHGVTEMGKKSVFRKEKSKLVKSGREASVEMTCDTVEGRSSPSFAAKSTWRIPKLSKKAEKDSNDGKKSGGSDGSVEKSESSVAMKATECKVGDSVPGEAGLEEKKLNPSAGTLSTWRIPKLSRKADKKADDQKPEKRSENLPSQDSGEKPGSSNRIPKSSAKKMEQCTVESEQPSEEQKHACLSQGSSEKDDVTVSDTSNIVSERLEQVKKSVGTSSPSHEKKPSTCVVAPENKPKSVLKKGPKISKSRSRKAEPVKQPDPVRERLKLAGELSTLHFLKGRLHERHLEKVFLRGDNITMVNLL